MADILSTKMHYSKDYDRGVDALCDAAIDYIRSIQRHAERDRLQRSKGHLPALPLTEDVIAAATLDGRGASALVDLAELFAELHNHTLSHGSYLLGQAEVLPEPYKSMVLEHGQYITTDSVDDWEITVTLREDADPSVRDKWGRP